jgi:hypothetical protein
MCPNCGGSVQETLFGPWCDPCGGVVFKPGPPFFRHVATVDGAGGRYPIVFDVSTGDYAHMRPGVLRVAAGRSVEGEFKRPMVEVAHGSLDAVIALSYPDAKGEGEGPPELSSAPSATPEERALIERGF